MGTPLTGQTPAESYIDLLRVSNSNQGLSGSFLNVCDGGGTDSALSISTSGVYVSGYLSLSGTVISASATEINKLHRTESDGVLQANKVVTADNYRGISTLGGDIDFISNGGGVSNGVISNFSASSFGYGLHNIGDSSNIQINPASGSVFKVTITSANTPISFTRPEFILNDYYAAVNRAYWVRLLVVQDATGSRNISWPATGLSDGNIYWPSGQWTSVAEPYPKITTPSYSPASGEMDIFDFWSYDHGINWIGNRVSSGIFRNG